MYHPVEFLPETVLAVITRGGHYDYACVNQATHCPARGIISIRVNRQSAETHVDHTDVVDRAIGHHPINSADVVPVPCEFKTRRLISLALDAMPSYAFGMPLLPSPPASPDT